MNDGAFEIKLTFLKFTLKRSIHNLYNHMFSQKLGKLRIEIREQREAEFLVICINMMILNGFTVYCTL